MDESELEQRIKLLDPEYQKRLYSIEQAQAQVTPPRPDVQMYPNDFDDRLMNLIDSVPME